MRLLYISEGISLSETFIAELSKGLRKKFEMTHVSSQTPYYKDGIDPVIIKYEIPANLSKNLNYILENRGKKIVYHLRQRKAYRKLKNYVKETDVIFVDYGTSAVRVMKLAKEYKKPLIVHFHGFDIATSLSNTLYKSDLKILFSIGTYFIAASFHIRRLLILSGCPDSQIEVIRYGVSLPDYNKSPIKYQYRKIDFIFMGRLTPKKNPVALIHAFKLVHSERSNSTLEIIGDGPLLNECKKLVQDLQMEKSISFRGAVSHSSAIGLLKNAKIYVQHSVSSLTGDQEGFAISLAEAALLELPIVSTLHNGIPENVIDTETGYLVREFDFEKMGVKMLELITNPIKAEEMGKKGRLHIKKLCSSYERINKVERLIHLAYKK